MPERGSLLFGALAAGLAAFPFQRHVLLSRNLPVLRCSDSRAEVAEAPAFRGLGVCYRRPPLHCGADRARPAAGAPAQMK